MDQRFRRVICSVAVLAVVGAVAAPVVWGQNDDVDPQYQPPIFTEPEIHLLDAIRIALENQPSIRLQSESAEFQRGVAQEETGAFDLTLLGEFAYEFVQQELTESAKEAERNKREQLRDLAQGFGASARDLEVLRDEIDVVLTNPVNCTDPSRPGVSDPDMQAQLLLLNTLHCDFIDSGDPGSAAGILETRADWLNSLKPIITENGEAARQAEADQLEKLDKLGDVPDIEQNYSGNLSLSLRKPYRSGVVLTPYLQLTGEGTGFKGKPKDPDYGGKGVIDIYRAVLGFTVDMPLGRNRGIEATGAGERSANIDYEASLDAITHTASAGVLNSVIAYWNLVAAQKQLEIWEQSLELQDRLVELTAGLIEAEEAAGTELTQTQARQADVRAEVDNARRAVHQARVTLATVIGLEVNETVKAPLAADDFPTYPGDNDLNAMMRSSLASTASGRRYDYRSALLLEKSGKVLLRAAEINLKPITDLTVDLSYSGLDENANPLKGMEGALFGNWAGPSGKVGLSVELPFGNNAQLGQYEQQGAAYRSRVISATDLDRTIKNNVILAQGLVYESVQQIRQNANAVAHYRKATDNEIEKYRYGSATVIDTILTEQRLTSALLALVSSQTQFARFLAQLRFETGTLIAEEEGGNFVSQQDLLTIPTGS